MRVDAEKRGSFYSHIKDPCSAGRVQAMLDALSRGIRSPEGLLEAAEKANEKLTKEVGNRSEENFISFAFQTKEVEFARKASSKDDLQNGIDAWVEFKPYMNLSPLPVQVKSSKKGVDEFRKSEKYKLLNEMVIVINCGHRIGKRLFQKQFRLETKRIRGIINANQL